MPDTIDNPPVAVGSGDGSMGDTSSGEAVLIMNRSVQVPFGSPKLADRFMVAGPGSGKSYSLSAALCAMIADGAIMPGDGEDGLE